ncbi:MAG: 2-hydroxychromene-2-carboxylate isomerase [Novosphingobium sp.]
MAPHSEPTFFYDFGSPNAWFAHRVLSGIEARTGASFRYVPVLLGGLFRLTINQAPMIAFAGIPAKTAYMRREMERFIQRHSLHQFAMNPHFPVNTLALMRGAVAAQHADVHEGYVEAMFKGMWEEGRKLDDPAVLSATLTEAGLPAERLLALAQDQTVKDQLVANTQMAFEAGAFGIPSFIVGGELYFGKDTLHEIEAELVGAA